MPIDDPNGHVPYDGSELAARVNERIIEMAGMGQRLYLSGLARHFGNDLSEADPLRSLLEALQYHFIADPDSEDRQLFGPFGPSFESILESGETLRFPQDLGEVGPDAIEAWRLCALEDVHPVVRARLADLLWEAREGGSPHDWAFLAIDSYVAAAVVVWGDPLELRDGLFRALELCRSLNQPDREGPIVRALINSAESSLDEGVQEPGVVIPILELLSERGDSATEQLVVRALDAYGGSPWIRESLLEIHVQLRPPEEHEEIWEQQVAGYVAEADRATGMLKHSLLQKAAELAAAKGLTDTHHEIATRIEATDWEDMGYGTVQAEVRIDREAIEEWVAFIVGDDDLDSALVRFGSDIPTGDVGENREFVERLAQEQPLQRLMSWRIMGDYNSIVWEVSDIESHQEFDLYRHERQKIAIFAQLLGLQALQRIVSRYPTSVEDLTELFTTQIIEPAVAGRIARSVELWQQDDADSAVSVLAPRLERVIRNACHLGGMRVTKRADMRRGLPGGVLGLGVLLSSLEGTIGETERRYLRGALVEVTSLNLRNRVAHGQIDDATDADYVVLFQIACWLRLQRVSISET